MVHKVTLGETAIEVPLAGPARMHDLTARVSIPYEEVLRAYRGPYHLSVPTEPTGVMPSSRSKVREGVFLQGREWVLASFEEGGETVILELADVAAGTRRLRRAVLGTDDPGRFLETLSERTAGLGLKDPCVRDAEVEIAAGSDDSDDDLGDDDPVAWTALRGGEEVRTSDGELVGHVTHPLGDPSLDVFEGIGFRKGVFGPHRMVRPEEIASITKRRVGLTIPAQDVAELPMYAEGDVRTASATGGRFFRHAGWKKDDNWHEPG